MNGIRAFNGSTLPLPRWIGPKWERPPSPLDIEVGCGTGMHSIRYATENPDRKLIAIERTSERFRKFQNSLSKTTGDLKNLTAVHADAVSWIYHRIGGAQVDRYFILYPNPYPKKKQSNRRWHAMPFMHFMLHTLKVGGSIEISTNLEGYAEENAQYMNRFWKLDLVRKWVFTKSDLVHSGLSPRTLFEKKYLDRGDPCFQLIYRKTQSDVGTRVLPGSGAT